MLRPNDLYSKARSEMHKPEPDLPKVADLLTRALESGDLRAAYALATWYLHGKYFKKSLRKALRYLKRAAEADVPESLYDLAVCFEKGAGVKKNPSKALEFYLRAALVGDKQSFYEVGRCYYYGIGVKADKRIAEVWLNHAGRHGVRD